MTAGEFFLAAPKWTPAGEGEQHPTSSWHLQTKGPPPSRGLNLARHSPCVGVSAPKGQRGESYGRALDGTLQSRALKRKEKAAPQESPRAKKKVMSVPATSLSCGSTCLGHTRGGTLRGHQAKS